MTLHGIKRYARALFLSVAAMGVTSGVFAQANRTAETAPVSTTGGPVTGVQIDPAVRAYLGIPFAAPPVGPLRWAAPQPIRWPGTYHADRTGAECIQVLRPHDINHYFGEEATSENCLFMNIWTPGPVAKRPRGGLPVIVFIYGGGFTIGSSGMPNYGGAEIARRGAIFVNFNYRVGAFGFMVHPDLSREQQGHSGNYGLMDQIAALRWVKANIAAFGGDPAKVTVMGQSAGAISVSALIHSPEARGLFSGAVMTSWCNSREPLPTLKDAEAVGIAVQERLKAGSLKAMRAIPADRILAIQNENQLGAHVEGVRIGGPIIDGYVLPAQKTALRAAGRVNRVPIIASANTDDIDIVMSPFGKVSTLGDYRGAAQAAFGPNADEFLTRFPATSDEEARAMARRVAHLAGFTLASRQCAVDQAATGQAAYLAEFSRKHPYAPGVTFADHDPAKVGAYHTGDIPYWLGTMDVYNSLRKTRDWTPYDRSLANTMMDALIAFTRDGKPGAAWPAWTADKQRWMVLGDTVGAQSMDTAALDWLEAHPVARTPAPRTGSPRD